MNKQHKHFKSNLEDNNFFKSDKEDKTERKHLLTNFFKNHKCECTRAMWIVGIIAGICILYFEMSLVVGVVCSYTDNENNKHNSTINELKTIQQQNQSLEKKVDKLNDKVYQMNTEINKLKKDLKKQKSLLTDNSVSAKNKLLNDKAINSVAKNISFYEKQRKITGYIKLTNKTIKDHDAKYMANCFIEAEKKFGVSAFMLAAIAKKESNYHVNSKSSQNAVGIMQVHWPSHQKNLKKAFATIRTKNDMFEIRNAILAGSWIYSMALKEYGNNHVKALNRYLSANSASYRNKVFSYKLAMERF